jgi:penicillin amidase
VPVPGWSGEFEWAGFVPVDRLPRIYNPTRGFVVTANNRALPDDYPYAFSTNWEPGYRAERITQLIEARPQLSVDAMARMQADVRTPQVRRLLPWMQRAQPADDESRAAMTRLAAWDGTLDAGSGDAALFMAWVDALTRLLFADELGDLYEEWAQWPHWCAKALDFVVSHSDDRWCDDVRTPQTEGCEHVIGLALRDALTGAAELQGTVDMSRWKLAEQNDVTFPHTPFHTVGWLRPVFSRHIEAAGNPTTIAPVMSIPRGQVISTFRQIVDLADFDNSRWVLPPGQSGQLLSRHYADQLERWRNVEYDRMLFSRKAVDAAAVSRLVLEPAR